MVLLVTSVNSCLYLLSHGFFVPLMTRFSYRFDSWSFHDVRTEVVRTRKWDVNGHSVNRQKNPSREVPWIVLAECRPTVDEAKVLMHT